jgi:hypothetical protein
MALPANISLGICIAYILKCLSRCSAIKVEDCYGFTRKYMTRHLHCLHSRVPFQCSVLKEEAYGLTHKYKTRHWYCLHSRVPSGCSALKVEACYGFTPNIRLGIAIAYI